MRRRILQIEGFRPFRHQAHETLARCQRHLAHHLWVQALVGDEVEASGDLVAQVDGTHLGVQNHGDARHQQIQGGAKAGRVRHVLNDLPQCV